MLKIIQSSFLLLAEQTQRDLERFISVKGGFHSKLKNSSGVTHLFCCPYYKPIVAFEEMACSTTVTLLVRHMNIQTTSKS